ncbi:MAG: phage head closure protein [Desulfitobacteriaceae bacterium]
MNPGILKHVIDIQKELTSRDSYGASTKEWVTFLRSARASVEPLTGREFFAAQQVNSEITHLVKMRYRSGIIPEMRLKFGNRYFDIRSAINIKEAGKEMYLRCTEVLPNG